MNFIHENVNIVKECVCLKALLYRLKTDIEKKITIWGSNLYCREELIQCLRLIPLRHG